MIAQLQTYFHYKGCNTMNDLIDVAPNGIITFGSELYTDSTSDKETFKCSNIGKQLVAGDLILANKGFLIQEYVPSGVSVNIPPFLTKGQFTEQEVKLTTKIARARIHVERAIGRMKDIDILENIPLNMRFHATKGFQVCAIQVNLQNPFIQEEGKTIATSSSSTSQGVW